jgi:hypothetical protein
MVDVRRGGRVSRVSATIAMTHRLPGQTAAARLSAWAGVSSRREFGTHGCQMCNAAEGRAGVSTVPSLNLRAGA